MFVAAGQPGDVKKIQGNVAAARKVFRIMRPLEALNPIIQNPYLNANKPFVIEVLNKLKPILMAIYFGADHVVWAQQAGLLTKKDLVARAQKTSLYGWFGGSLCTILTEVYEIGALTLRREGESDEEYRDRQYKDGAEVQRRLLTLIHACFQAALAMGLLELRPWKPRTVGALGIIASALNCYMLFPPVVRPLWGGKPSLKIA
jgi:Peroxisomal biogenesis factor 11 (PEX11)